MRIVVAALSLVVLHVSACAFDLDGCASDEDCPAGTTCGRPAGTGAPMCIAPGLDPTDHDTGTTSEPDEGGRPDTPVIPWPDEDMGGPTDACPAVTDCGESEPNDTEDDALYLSPYALGCAGFELEEWSSIHQDSLCANDVDQFIIEYVACDAGAFKLTVSLTTPDTCRNGGDLEIAEGLYDCRDPNVRCEVVDGAERITIIIPEHPYPQPVEKIRFAVRTGLAVSGVEYILRATIGR